RRARAPYRGSWDLPGGFLEAEELPLEALRREVREELGVGVRRSTLIGFTSDRYGPGGFEVLAVIYRTHLTSPRLHPPTHLALPLFPPRPTPYAQTASPPSPRCRRRYVRSLR